jgi:hypothetical protein
MKSVVLKALLVGVVAAGMTSCELFRGPDRTGEIRLSSELFGTDSYYLFGYHYEDGEYYRFSALSVQGDPIPDIINEGTRVLRDGEVAVLPLFRSPKTGEKVGLALINEFQTLEEARNYYDDYKTVGNDLQYEILSNTVVDLYQVWIQRTGDGNYAKLLVKDILFETSDSGSKYSVVVMDYTYQPNGSSTFPD